MLCELYLHKTIPKSKKIKEYGHIGSTGKARTQSWVFLPLLRCQTRARTKPRSDSSRFSFPNFKLLTSDCNSAES